MRPGSKVLADAVAVLATVCVGVLFAAIARPECLPGADCNSYLRMAADPSSLSSVPAHHAGRILPSLAARAIALVTGGSIPAAFRVLAALGYVALPLLVYGLLRARAGPAAALAGASWLWIAPSSVANVIFDNGQAGHLFALVALVGITVAAERGRAGAVAVVGLAGALCRQEVLIAALAALAVLAIRRRAWMPLALAGAVAAPVLLLAAAVESHVPGVLGAAAHALSPGAVLGAWTHPAVWIPIWTLCPAGVALWWRGGVRSGAVAWLLPFAAAVLALDTGIVAVAGPDNYGRIIQLGLWPLGLELVRAMTRLHLPVVAWAVAGLLPFGYVAARRALGALEQLGAPVPGLEEATIVYGALAPLVLAALVWRAAPPRAPGPAEAPAVRA